MRTLAMHRLLVAGFSFALIAFGALSAPATAKNTTDWSETTIRENFHVQSCATFDVTSSYTANVAYHLTTDNSGDEVLERMNVDFAGAIGNSVTSKSYAYGGTFTRWSDYIRNKVTISELALQFEMGTTGEFTVAVDRIELDLIADPAEVIKQFLPNALQMDLCYLLGDSPGERKSGSVDPLDPLYPYVSTTDPLDLLPPYITGTSERILSASDTMTPWTGIDPCDTTPPGQSC